MSSAPNADRACMTCGASLAGMHFNRRYCSEACQPKAEPARTRETTPRPGTRARTISARTSLRVLREGAEITTPEHERPRTRGDCQNGARPCPFVSCRHHLYLDIVNDNGSIKLNFPDIDPEELVETCSLDVADRGEHTLDEVGKLLNVTRERVRQVADETGKRVRFALKGFL